MLVTFSPQQISGWVLCFVCKQKFTLFVPFRILREIFLIARQILPLFDKAEAQNKLLRSVAGGGVEVLTQLQGRWDKFELMMESHQLMVKEQVRVLNFCVLWLHDQR